MDFFVNHSGWVFHNGSKEVTFCCASTTAVPTGLRLKCLSFAHITQVKLECGLMLFVSKYLVYDLCEPHKRVWFFCSVATNERICVFVCRCDAVQSTETEQRRLFYRQTDWTGLLIWCPIALTWLQIKLAALLPLLPMTTVIHRHKGHSARDKERERW